MWILIVVVIAVAIIVFNKTVLNPWLEGIYWEYIGLEDEPEEKTCQEHTD